MADQKCAICRVVKGTVRVPGWIVGRPMNVFLCAVCARNWNSFRDKAVRK